MTPEQFAERVKRMLERLTRESDPSTPALVNPPLNTTIDDGAGYGDPLRDTRPDIVQEAMQGYRTVFYLKDGPRE